MLRLDMPEQMAHQGVLDRPALLIAGATLVAVVSFLSHLIVPSKTLLSDLALGYVPILLGCVSMLLCDRARRRTTHRRLVTLYAVIISPFAFSYPAWILILWILYAPGRYNGSMP
jgi:hypothetical protein